jgi:predicted nucleotidyltransferase
MDAIVVDTIKTRLIQIEADNKVSIPLAVESGSRAWGFPSPDSDYDCRFIYVPRIDDALGLFVRRDVIETPLTPVFDVNGWELRKAIKLMLKGNAVVLEWLKSPMLYRRNESFALQMMDLAEAVFQRGAIANHYCQLMRGNRARHFSDPSNVPLKKIFYAVRSALAVRYLSLNPDFKSLPMNLQELCAGCNLPTSLQGEIDSLVLQKSEIGELGFGPLPPSVIKLMEEAEEKTQFLVFHEEKLGAFARAEAENVYLSLLRQFAPS